jgi:hypothetical protein
MLRTFIPESIWREHRCLVVHPGPKGDRGASWLDWAIELGMRGWGATLLQANGDFDGGDVWATRTFATRDAGKSSLYREEMARSHASFFGPDRGYHEARRRFTHKLGTDCGATDASVVVDQAAGDAATRVG